jgi:hypothetical protein
MEGYRGYANGAERPGGPQQAFAVIAHEFTHALRSFVMSLLD